MSILFQISATFGRFVCLIYVRFCQLRAHWTSLRVGSGYRVTRAIPYSFSKEPSGSFTCPVYNPDIWDLGLESHPKNIVRRGIELMTPDLTVYRASPRLRATSPSVLHDLINNDHYENELLYIPFN